MSQSITLLWLDRCLTLYPNDALQAAVQHARQHNQPLLAFYSVHRTSWLNSRLPAPNWVENIAHQARIRVAFDAQQELAAHGIELHITDLPAIEVIAQVHQHTPLQMVFTDAYADVYKVDNLRALEERGIPVQRMGSNTLLDDTTRQELPDALVGRFTKFYHRVKHLPTIIKPGAHVQSLEPGLLHARWPFERTEPILPTYQPMQCVLPLTQADLSAWWDEYLWQTDAIAAYKHTRNQPFGRTAFSRLSGALALGTLSPQAICAQIDAYEEQRQKNASTEWLRYELYWREYFHWVGERLGDRLFQAPVPALTPQQQAKFTAWCAGETGEGIVDAGLRELCHTGFISNRIRQLVASYLVHDMAVPWQYGAAWFERHLIDFDVHSNYGNWAYIAGRHPLSAEPHRFDIAWQTQQHDASGAYRARWLS
ncbi:FAD-binding domain-containing protein [Salinispirillum marinum]|uniref:FAD-binding domain-containing protein n=2 Tax=Saccharospirillaceae TaxID=255527 RepID=A0ABV8BCS1_9GAMM